MKKKSKIKKDPLDLDPRKWAKISKKLGAKEVKFT